jgi:ribosomal protein L29
MGQKDNRELHNKGEEELKAQVLGLKEKLRQAKLELATKKIKNYRLIKTIKDNIARALTVIREKEFKV